MKILKTKLERLKHVRDFLDNQNKQCSSSRQACPRLLGVWSCRDCLTLYKWRLTPWQLYKLAQVYLLHEVASPCPCLAEESGYLAPGEAITILDNTIDELSEELSNS
jgi:hypothetical protein